MSPRSRDNAAKREQGGKNRLVILTVAALFAVGALQVTQAQKKKPEDLRSSMAVTGSEIQSLNGKLQGFERQLSDQERAAFSLLLLRAAKAPLDDPSGTEITGSFFDLGSPVEKAAGGGIYLAATGPTTGASPKPKIGGAGGQPPAVVSKAGRDVDEPNRPPPPQPRLEVLSAALGTANVSAGRDGPKPPPPDLVKALETKLVGFGNQLSLHERGIMNWLLQRAGNAAKGSSSENVPRPTPGGPQPALTQALGLAAFGSRPGTSSPGGWVLRF